MFNVKYTGDSHNSSCEINSKIQSKLKNVSSRATTMTNAQFNFKAQVHSRQFLPVNCNIKKQTTLKFERIYDQK